MKPSKRRAHPRISLRIPVTVSFGTKEIDVVTVDGSLGGLQLLCDEPWPIGTQVMVTLSNRKRRVSSEAMTVSSRENRVGLQFDAPPPEFIEVFGSLLENELEGGGRFAERRVAHRVEAKVALLLSGTSGFKVLISRNLSRTGALLECDPNEIPDGELVLMLAEHGLFEMRARVVRRLQDGVGVEFVSGSPASYDALYRMLCTLMGIKK